MLFVVRCMWFVGVSSVDCYNCLLPVVCGVLFVVSCALVAVRCLLCAVWCSLFVDCCVLVAARWLAVCWSLCVIHRLRLVIY